VGATLSVLFTDAVASTEALARLGDERFGAIERAHLALLRAALEAHGGREVKSLGDGLMVVFDGAAEALGCAVAMQQAVEAGHRRGEDGLALRVGVASGDVTVGEDGDVHGTAVVEAARLCAAASAGQILATSLARGLAGSRGGHAFTALGPVALKGLAEPVDTVEVGWAPLTEDDVLAPVPLPPRVAVQPPWAFVGRAPEMARLQAAWRRAADGPRQVVLLGGEPGAGKTRLARELAVSAHQEGALVLFGRVDEHLEVAYQPFAEALRHCLGGVDDETRTRVLGLRGGVLGRLVPELVDDLPARQVDAWAVLEGLVDWLAGEAAQRPVVLALDDLHWAARPTLQAFLHLARSERLARVLILGTYRDTELDREHPFGVALADLRREQDVERVTVGGLDREGVAAFVGAEHAALAGQISEQTQGNPFFVGQLLHHLGEAGTIDDTVPDGVRDVVGRRVARLSAQTGDLLRVAAVAGPEFETSIVATVTDQSGAIALDGFDAAIGAGLLLETETPGRLRFVHALARQALEEDLTGLRRVHLHRDLALALQQRFGDADGTVAELANHFAAAAPIGEGERAAHYAERAAGLAAARGAPDQALELLERALALLPPDTDPDGHRRVHLHALLIHTSFHLLAVAYMETIGLQWMALGRELGDEDVTTVHAVAVTIEGILWHPADPAYLAAITRALHTNISGLDVGDRQRVSWRGVWCTTDAHGLRALLLANAASTWALGAPMEAIAPGLGFAHPLAMADEACRVAELSADPEIISDTRVNRSWALAATPDAAAALPGAERTAQLGYHVAGGAFVPATLALARLGRLDDLCDWIDLMLDTCDRTGDRSVLTCARMHQALVALARERYEDARIATERALAIDPSQLGMQRPYAILTIARLLALDRPDEARPIADRLAADPSIDYSALRAVVAVAQGDPDPARALLRSWHARGRPIPVDLTRSGRLWGLAECAHATGDRDAARHLYDLLLPYDGQLLLYWLDFIPASAPFTLGRLVATLGDDEQALAHYRAALVIEEQAGTTALAARTRQALAEAVRHP
jgi:class 3 adenylate cyclase/tetratricopeptide (TPR) repeat protein